MLLFLNKVKSAEAAASALKGNSDSTFLLFKKVRKMSNQEAKMLALLENNPLTTTVICSPGLSTWREVSLRKE